MKFPIAWKCWCRRYFVHGHYQKQETTSLHFWRLAAQALHFMCVRKRVLAIAFACFSLCVYQCVRMRVCVGVDVSRGVLLLSWQVCCIFQRCIALSGRGFCGWGTWEVSICDASRWLPICVWQRLLVAWLKRYLHDSDCLILVWLLYSECPVSRSHCTGTHMMTKLARALILIDSADDVDQRCVNRGLLSTFCVRIEFGRLLLCLIGVAVILASIAQF